MESANSPVSALVVDDEADVRLLVRLGIDAHNGGLYVCGEADSGPAALDMLLESRPDVVVLDQMMPGMDGLETTAHLREIAPDIRIVLFSAFLDDDLEQRAARAGVSACLLKTNASDLPPLLLDVARRPAP
jgi:two-component system, NarL family, response regulator LiaR